MKKILAVLLVGLAATSFGVVNIDWGSTYGFYFGVTDPGVGILAPNGSTNATIAELVYCGANGLRDKVNIGGGALLDDEVTAGDDVVWGTYAITLSGDAQADSDGLLTYAHFNGNLQNYQQAFVTGNFYARIFQSSDIKGGDWYFYTKTTALADVTGSMFAQAIELAPDAMVQIDAALMNPTTGSGFAGTSQVIPEPATFLLMGIGGMGAWLLRRRQQA